MTVMVKPCTQDCLPEGFTSNSSLPGLFAFVSGFMMSVGMSQSPFHDPASTEVWRIYDIFLAMVTDTSLRRWILATTVMVEIFQATCCSSLERSSPLGIGDLLPMIIATVLRVRVFLKYMAVDTLFFVSAPGPFWDRGDMPRWGLMAGTAACCTQYIRHCPFLSPFTLYSHSQRRCPPPWRSGGDATPRKDARQDR